MTNPSTQYSPTISGAEFRDFYQNNWPGPEWYIDDVAFEFEDDRGNYILSDTAKVLLSDCGFLVWQGPAGKPHRPGAMFAFADFFEKYRSSRTSEIMVPVVAEVPHDRLDEMLSFLASIGARIQPGQARLRLRPEPAPGHQEQDELLPLNPDI
mgnify:CR=1 FL=1